jgi:TonB-dependent starch-binding outer membrane protein SusC
VKGTNNQTTSLEDGTFKIAGVKGSDVLVFSSVGYLEQEVPVKNQSVINLSLDISQKTLNDVVVIGYGTQKKKNVTGAVSTFDARKLEERPIQRIDQAMVGQLAGVTVK